MQGHVQGQGPQLRKIEAAREGLKAAQAEAESTSHSLTASEATLMSEVAQFS